MRSSQWEIIYFETSRGDSPIFTFINELSIVDQAKISNTLDLLAEYGTKLGSPHVKKLHGTNLWELRVLGKNNIRIFYVTLKQRTFILLHAFLKKRQKTPTKELRIATHRLKTLQNTQL